MTAAIHGLGGEGSTVVVGAGHAGGTLVSLLRQHRHEGRVVMMGAEPHPPYHRPPLSKKFFSNDYKQLLRPIDFYRSQDIDVRLSTTVANIDRDARTVLTADGGAVAYDHLVLATGAEALRLNVPGANLTGIISLRTLDDAIELRKIMDSARRFVVIGGGYVGLEVAAETVAHGGVSVTVLEREQRVLARVASAEFSALMQEQHTQRGVEILTAAEVIGFTGDCHGAVRTVQLLGGHEIECDAVLVGIGAAPRDQLARDCGISCDSGILVDDSSRTSDPAVFAIGDVTKRPLAGKQAPVRLESIPSAVEQAKQAAAAIAGHPPPPAEVPWFWSRQFDLHLKIAGLIRRGSSTIRRGDPDTGRFALFHLDSEDAVIAAETSNSAALFTAAKHMIGRRARAYPDRLRDAAVDIRNCFESG